ncbi:MAG TPA: DNA-processing protein DprA [Actinomycetota bacterium]
MFDLESRRDLLNQVDSLERRGVEVHFLTDSDFPPRLAALDDGPPLLFTWGNTKLFSQAGVGMCGSRNVSNNGLRAARSCGLEVASHGLVIISGYAKGVDTETHLAALASGGQTVIVLAEGILHFRQKKVFEAVGLDPQNVLVVSQFAPSQPWNVGAAMARNAIIAGLGTALVVVEAGERGGTLNAGLRALKIGRPVLALDFGGATPPGNELLFKQGAIRISSTDQLGKAIRTISQTPKVDPAQLRFEIA